MEKAILKTLIYADIFDYPLSVFEIHKWLIGRKVDLWQVEKALEKLRVKGILRLRSVQEAERVKDYYFLPGKNGLVIRRKYRERQSAKYLLKAKMLSQVLKIIPWIKLVGVSGGLALGNASKKDDIDFFIITSKKRLWLSRLMVLGLLSLTGQRRKVGDLGRKIAGKFCINTLLEEDRLEQNSKDIYLAHEVLQMKVLWEKDEVYGKFLSDNEWVFKFLPNWVGWENGQWKIDVDYFLTKMDNGKLRNKNSQFSIVNSQFNTLEYLAKRFQLWYMKQPKGMERIQDGALYFHPKDYRKQILEEFEKRIKNLIIP